MLRQLRKVLALGRRGWSDLLRAQGALLRAAWRLRREPIDRLVGREPAGARSPTGDPARAQSLDLAIRRASRYGLFRPYCLVQALALQELLVVDGIHGATICVGVRRNGGRFEAHAWVRWNGRVLADEESHVSLFTEVDDPRVLDRA